MKINEVEALVGITQKNIRFYETQGLLSPSRNSKNGYRDYSEADVGTLEQIKLMRKLGLPLEDIRQMQAGTCTLADGMRRHLVTLEREKQNTEQSIQLCRRLTQYEGRLDGLEAKDLLCEMEEMEQMGTTFQDKQIRDRKPRRYLGAVAAAALFSGLISIVIALMVWVYLTDPADSPPLPLLAVFVGLLVFVILGVLFALLQRVREISSGEIDDAKNY